MKFSLFRTAALYLLFALVSACNSKQAKEQELKEKELQLQQQEQDLERQKTELSLQTSQALPNTVKKYMYVVITTDEPKIISKMIEEKTSDVSYPPTLRYVTYARSQYFTYTSEVIEVEDFNEDAQFREEDKFQRNIQSHLADVNRDLEISNRVSGNDPVNAVAKVLSRKSYVFDSYSEASRHRSDATKHEQ